MTFRTSFNAGKASMRTRLCGAISFHLQRNLGVRSNRRDGLSDIALNASFFPTGGVVS